MALNAMWERLLFLSKQRYSWEQALDLQGFGRTR